MRDYAELLGRAFQIRDDILDVSGDTACLGKPVGSDAQNEKSTFVTALGMDKCEQLVKKLTGEAIDALSCFDDHGFHDWLAVQLAGRDH